MSNVTNIKAKTFVPQAASTTSLAAAQQTAGAQDLVLTGTAVNDGSNMQTSVTLTSAGNLSGVAFAIEGTDSNGAIVNEAGLTGPNNNTVTSARAYLTVTKISVNGAVGTNVSAGFVATNTGQGIIFAGRTKIRGLQGYSDNAAGNIEFTNGSQSGTPNLLIYTGAADYDLEPYIPDNGVLFPDGAYLDMQSTQVCEGLTVFFDG